ncbi:hypothetical protein BRE01_48370 [Brevibacillus reuszeri]|uniref:Uncharacterized protein YyaB-like PH domain-containing protein n=1 Tax=Brevibacillus reuszeri TaxID=54915 RepID=A0A0K9YYM8_9BACL|nr:PH domain-containing protein [Brevibacillus reuszeri]KNB73799.1 hypothetical protein ADS79_07665 [Brevibacillus reuszeri]MED1860058.1 PH domain-containing protein [Brevibacillus reuszeri]GED71135.1 hypothetical protein BRE01_48370 [Brevibacillus reuszeri]
MRFVTRRDLWLSITIWACVLLAIFSGLSPLLISGADAVGGTVVFIISFGVAGLLLWIWLGTVYYVTESTLVIHNGPFKKIIPLESITSVKSVRSVVASAATSAQRLEILYNKYDIIYISPLDEEAFLAEVQKRCPRATVHTR